MRTNRESTILLCDRVMEYALYILILFLPISKAIIEICASLAILAFIIKKIITRKLLPYTSLNKFLFLYVGICALSIIFSTNIHMSLRALFTKLLEGVLIYFIIVETVNNKKKMHTILTILFLSATLVCIDGIFQYFTHIDFLRHRSWPYSIKPFTLRITGPFVTSNDFAAYLAPLGILSLGLIFIKSKNLFIKYFLKILPILLLICLFLTLSRGAWIGAFVGLIFIGFFVNKKSFFRLLLVLFVSFSLLWQFLPEDKKHDIAGRFNIFDAGGRDRKALTKISWDMWSDRPIFGLGLGTYMYNFEKFNYDKKAYPWGPSYAHNCYLQTAAETGLLGLLSFLLLLIALFRNSIGRLKRYEISLERSLTIGLLGALCAYLIHSVFDTNLYNLDIGMLFWFLLGLSQSQLKIMYEK